MDLVAFEQIFWHLKSLKVVSRALLIAWARFRIFLSQILLLRFKKLAFIFSASSELMLPVFAFSLYISPYSLQKYGYYQYYHCRTLLNIQLQTNMSFKSETDIFYGRNSNQFWMRRRLLLKRFTGRLRTVTEIMVSSVIIIGRDMLASIFFVIHIIKTVCISLFHWLQRTIYNAVSMFGIPLLVDEKPTEDGVINPHFLDSLISILETYSSMLLFYVTSLFS